MHITHFDEPRRALHQQMAAAYQGFLAYLFVQNKHDHALHRSMNEARIKFLSSYFLTHAPARGIFAHSARLSGKESPARRYVVADYYSTRALQALGKSPAQWTGLRFEHVVPKDSLKREFEERAQGGSGLPSSAEIASMLDKTWHIAVVTVDEDTLVRPRDAMPPDWDRCDVFARYREPLSRSMRFELHRASEDAERCREILRAA